jgi:hypothetical protein
MKTVLNITLEKVPCCGTPRTLNLGEKMIETIKEIRVATGCGLKEAKDFFDMVRNNAGNGVKYSMNGRDGSASLKISKTELRFGNGSLVKNISNGCYALVKLETQSEFRVQYLGKTQETIGYFNDFTLVAEVDTDTVDTYLSLQRKLTPSRW